MLFLLLNDWIVFFIFSFWFLVICIMKYSYFYFVVNYLCFNKLLDIELLIFFLFYIVSYLKSELIFLK